MNTRGETPSRRKFLGIAGVATAAAMAQSSLPLVAGSEVLAAGKPGRHRWGFLIDLERCIGCKACSVACKTEHNVPLGVFRCSVKEHEEGAYPQATRHFVPWRCNHCENPVCVADCPVDEIEATFIWPDQSRASYRKRATYQRPDGLVLVDQDHCIGCGACVDLCPYKARFLNPVRKSEDGDPVADKCSSCAHQLDAGVRPACVVTCQAEARVVGDLNDPESEISQRIKDRQVAVLLPGKGTEPQCLYLGLNPAAYAEGRDTR